MNKCFTSLLLLIIATIFLHGCATSTQSGGLYPVKLNYSRSDSANGVVLFSLSTSKAAMPLFFSLEIVDTETKIKTTLGGSTYIPDVKNDSARRNYSAVVLPKGNYKLYGWKISNGQMDLNPKGNFSIPFTLFGGDVNYIGDYRFESRNVVRTKRGIWPYSEVYFVVSNRYAQDAAIVESKFPDLDLTSVLNAMPDFAGSNSKFSVMFLKGINIP